MSDLHWMRWKTFPGVFNSYSIPGNEWTTLNEMESISRYIILIFYTWKWVNYTEWDGQHFQVYHSHFIFLEMSELHWMRWTAFPGISFSFSIPGNEWTTLNDMGKHFQVYHSSFSIPGNRVKHSNERGSISRYIILIFYTWKWVNYTEWDGKHFQVYHSHFLYLEMSELHWMRWRAFPGISFSFSIPGNEWTTLNEMESISRYIILIFYTWKWVNYTEWDGEHFQVYPIDFQPGNEWPALNEMENISRCI